CPSKDPLCCPQIHGHLIVQSKSLNIEFVFGRLMVHYPQAPEKIFHNHVEPSNKEHCPLLPFSICKRCYLPLRVLDWNYELPFSKVYELEPLLNCVISNCGPLDISFEDAFSEFDRFPQFCNLVIP